MQITAIILSLLLASTAQVFASPVPDPRNNKNNNNNNNNNNQSKNCQAAKKVANSIDDNLKQQQQELTVLLALRNEVGRNVVNVGQFQSDKNKLIKTINNGIKARSKAQRLAPKGNAAINGLGIIQKSQELELQEAKSLQGNSQDLAVIAKIMAQDLAAITQNKQNKKDATKGCN